MKYLPADTKFIATDITSPFFVPLKLTAIIAFIINLPNTCYQIWVYIAPALYKQEKFLLVLFSLAVIFLFILGIFFCYYIMLPLLFTFISHIKSEHILMMADIGKYLDLLITLCVTFGLSFQMPIIIFTLIWFNIVRYETLKSSRPYIFVGIFIFAAIVTPPDVLSQIMLAIPIYLLYELGLILSKILKK